MATTTRTDLEEQVASVVSGHRMAGFDIDEDDRALVREVLTGKRTADDVVAEVKAGLRRRD